MAVIGRGIDSAGAAGRLGAGRGLASTAHEVPHDDYRQPGEPDTIPLPDQVMTPSR